MRGTETMTMRARPLALAALAALALTSIAGCSSSDPLKATASGTSGGDVTSVTVGSANFAESELVMDLYGLALEDAGLKVDYKPNIGARETYVAAVEDGSIDIVPDYTGNLLGYLDPDSTATSREDVLAALPAALPDTLSILQPADAEDKDSLNVTEEFATAHGLKTIADLAGAGHVRLGANAEFEERPYGIPGLEKVYGVKDVDFVAINDGGGPNTVKALTSGKVDVADIYTTTPAIAENGLVTLEDPENLIAAQNVVPLVATRVRTDTVTKALDAVSAQLTTADLLAMNGRVSGDEKADPKDVAKDWLVSKGLLTQG